MNLSESKKAAEAAFTYIKKRDAIKKKGIKDLLKPL